MNNLDKIFNIEKNDIISITGAGGKTTLMFSLAQVLSKSGSVLITTSTKITVPKDGFNKLYTSFDQYSKPKANEIVCIGELISEKNKLASIGYDKLKNIVEDFDYCIIEADGSRNLPMKFWKDYEPVIYDFTNKTIGVLSIKVYGRKASADFIYNYKEFIEFIDEQEISYKTYNKIIDYNNGLFKDFNGSKFVFINQVETDLEIEQVNKIIKNDRTGIDIIYGSLKEEVYYEN